MLHDQIARDEFWPLPDHGGQSSAERRIGVEVEFAGLSVEGTGELLRGLWGGEITERAERMLVIEGGLLGELRVELDLSLQQKWLEDLAEQSLGELIPVELITGPLRREDLGALTAGLEALNAAGGMGTQDRLGFGFGVHFNPELPGKGAELDAFIAIARAFALLEDWLRHSAPLDPARRVLPFVNPWPVMLIDLLAAQTDADLPQFARGYAQLAPARGFGLDLLPALEHLAPEALADVPATQLKGGRPTFHYRLPEARLGDENWSLAYEWNRWVLVERVAADADCLGQLAEDWQAHRTKLLSLRRDWATHVETVLSSRALLAGAAPAQGLARG